MSTEDYESELQHRSSLSGCHEDCPACAEGSEKYAQEAEALKQGTKMSKLTGTNRLTGQQHITYWWRREVGTEEIQDNHIEALYESATARASEMIAEGFTSGELHDNVRMQEDESDEGVQYSGWWAVSTAVPEDDTTTSGDPVTLAFLAGGYNSMHLDDAVHQAASGMATDANNGGIAAQVKFLVAAGRTPEEILEAAKQAKAEDE